MSLIALSLPLSLPVHLCVSLEAFDFTCLFLPLPLHYKLCMCERKEKARVSHWPHVNVTRCRFHFEKVDTFWCYFTWSFTWSSSLSFTWVECDGHKFTDGSMDTKCEMWLQWDRVGEKRHTRRDESASVACFSHCDSISKVNLPHSYCDCDCCEPFTCLFILATNRGQRIASWINCMSQEKETVAEKARTTQRKRKNERKFISSCLATMFYARLFFFFLSLSLLFCSFFSSLLLQSLFCKWMKWSTEHKEANCNLPGVIWPTGFILCEHVIWDTAYTLHSIHCQ